MVIQSHITVFLPSFVFFHGFSAHRSMSECREKAVEEGFLVSGLHPALVVENTEFITGNILLERNQFYVRVECGTVVPKEHIRVDRKGHFLL